MTASIASSPSLLIVCLNPVLQKTLTLTSLREGEVNRVTTHRIDASGKGINLSRVFTQLGGHSAVLTHLEKRQRRSFLKLCSNDHISLITANTEAPLRHGYTLIDTVNNITTEVIEEGASIEQRCVNLIMSRFKRSLPLYRAIAITGSKAAGYPDTLYPEMVSLAKKRGIRVYCDLRGSDLRGCIEAGADIIKINLEEFNQTFALYDSINTKPYSLESALDKAREFEKYGTRTIITLGSAGAGGYDCGKVYRQEGSKISPRNTIGCGDAYLAGFIHSYENDTVFCKAMETGASCAIRNALSIRPGSILDDTHEHQ